MTQVIFFVYVVLIALGLGATALTTLSRRASRLVLAGMAAWLIYVGLLSYLGIVANPTLRPPGAAYILLPVAALVTFLATSSVGGRLAAALALPLLLGAQSFRIGVELLLHQIALDGLAPRMMTYEGGNFDILIGLTALVAAWVSTRGRLGQRLALAWNFVGLAALANVAIRAIGSAPGSLHFIHSDVPNVAVGMFPFTYLAGFLAPLAMVLHVLAIRSLRQSLRTQALAVKNSVVAV